MASQSAMEQRLGSGQQWPAGQRCQYHLSPELAVTWRVRRQVSVGTEGGWTLPLSAGETVQTEERVRAAEAGGHGRHAAVPAVVDVAGDPLTVPGTQQAAGAAPAGGCGGDRAVRAELHQAACTVTGHSQFRSVVCCPHLTHL